MTQADEAYLAELEIDLASAEPIVQQLTRSLRRAIVTMRIAPGEMLSEQEIAKKLGISRQPVREAIFKLREVGLIRVLPQRGTLVLKISQRAVEEARFVREAVECAIVREAAQLAGPSMIDELAAVIDRQRRAAEDNSAAAFFSLDEAFHQLLAEAADRPSAWSVVEDVKPQMDRVRFLNVEGATARNTIIAHHSAVLDAIRAHDAATAENAMRVHLRAMIRSLPLTAVQHAHLFEDAQSDRKRRQRS
jgi:DNA-binding GntR family transcriptional regulator